MNTNSHFGLTLALSSQVSLNSLRAHYGITPSEGEVHIPVKDVPSWQDVRLARILGDAIPTLTSQRIRVNELIPDEDECLIAQIAMGSLMPIYNALAAAMQDAGLSLREDDFPKYQWSVPVTLGRRTRNLSSAEMDSFLLALNAGDLRTGNLCLWEPSMDPRKGIIPAPWASIHASVYA
jgi:hypothetical protein